MARLLNKLASVKLTVILLFILAVLVVWGTLYQAENGLFEAQQRFYRSHVFFVWGFIPFPGTQLVLALLFFNLLSSLFVNTRYELKHVGSVLTHLGLLILLGGGFLVGLHAMEASLTLQEGAGSNLASSYHQWEMAFWDPGDDAAPDAFGRQTRRVTAVDTDSLRPGQAIDFGNLGFAMEVESYHRNADPHRHGHDEGNSSPPPLNASGYESVGPQPAEKEPGRNLPGGVFSVKTGQGDPQRILLFGGDSGPTLFEVGDKVLVGSLRRACLPLPFTVALKDFQRDMHPGSSMARSFTSDVVVMVEETSRPVHIAMNEPLRYRGFTLFQSSYREVPDGREYSTFAVVRNHGRLLPYVASLVIFVGLTIHFMVVVYQKRPRGT